MTEELSSKDIALIAARAIDEKKGSDIVIQDVAELLNITDYFIICTAANKRRADSIAEEVEKKIKEQAGGLAPASIEGLDEMTWVLMDYGQVVVHIFQPAERDFYRLEQLWSEAPTVDVAVAGIEDPVYTERIAALLGRQQDAGEGAAEATGDAETAGAPGASDTPDAPDDGALDAASETEDTQAERA